MPTRRRLPIWPLVFAIAAVALSVGLAAIVLTRMGTGTALPFAIVGYVLAPFAASAALVWARAIDLRLQADPLYLKADGRTRVRTVGVVAACSFIPALVHIWYVAGFVGESLS